MQLNFSAINILAIILSRFIPKIAKILDNTEYQFMRFDVVFDIGRTIIVFLDLTKREGKFNYSLIRQH